MAASLTEKEFSKHLNTKFRVNLDVENGIDLDLLEVKGYLSQQNEQTGMERFSVFFQGPTDPLLRQQVYTLGHEQMGEFEIFLVPLAQADSGSRYEAVFNYFESAE